VRKSLIKRVKLGDLLHTSEPRCLDSFDDAKLISKQQKSLPPNKQNNKLFAELLALKLNIMASVYNKFPNGLGELTFDDQSDPLNPFNGEMVNDIVKKTDTVLSCLPVTSISASPTFSDLYWVVRKIDSAFSGG